MRIIRLGKSSFMTPKPFSPDEWKQIVRKLCLSTREAEVAALVLHGLKDEAIATRLKVKKPTVRTHLKNMFESLEVNSRLGLAMRIFIASRDDCDPI
jgi:DNA-binding NarL/FixJ family response regulator